MQTPYRTDFADYIIFTLLAEVTKSFVNGHSAVSICKDTVLSTALFAVKRKHYTNALMANSETQYCLALSKYTSNNTWCKSIRQATCFHQQHW